MIGDSEFPEVGGVVGAGARIYTGQFLADGAIIDRDAPHTREGGRLRYPFSPTPGRWYHIAYSFDGPTKQQALYVDTALVAIGVGTKNPGYDTSPFLLGCDLAGGGYAYPLLGRIDEAALYNRALSASEIAAVYTAGAGGKRQFFPIETWKFSTS